VPTTEGGITKVILQGVMSGVLSQIGNQGAGWILRMVIEDDTTRLEQLRQEVETIQEELVAIGKELENIEVKIDDLRLNQDWLDRTRDVEHVQDKLKAQLWTLGHLKAGDKEGGDEAAKWARKHGMEQLGTVHSRMVTEYSVPNPGQPGLLRLYAIKCLQANQAAPDYGRRVVGAGSPLDRGYRDFENYFRSMINLEVHGPDGRFNAMVRDWLQAPEWRPGVESESDPAIVVWGYTIFLAFREQNNTLRLLSSHDGVAWTPVSQSGSPSFSGDAGPHRFQ
jgi:hypothetical protein